MGPFAIDGGCRTHEVVPHVTAQPRVSTSELAPLRPGSLHGKHCRRTPLSGGLVSAAAARDQGTFGVLAVMNLDSLVHVKNVAKTCVK